MTREEAIKTLEDGSWWDLLLDDAGDASMNLLHDALDVALAALREQEKRENPPMLTWEELTAARETPVFIVDSKNHERYWAIVGGTCQFPGRDWVFFYVKFSYDCYYRKDYGKTWTAYRHEPKGDSK